ncbi:hypothetical protein HYS54_00975 [Candidatus Micrarchaeota archaeon]|nr:hypothetical protein [Candidatus Micrarchaeota archaeon]
MIQVSSSFNALRMVAGQKDPILLEVTLKNAGKEPVFASASVRLPFMLGFDQIGLMREKQERVGLVGAGGEKTVSFRIYCKPLIRDGNYDITANVNLHPPDRFDKTLNTIIHHTNLRIIPK